MKRPVAGSGSRNDEKGDGYRRVADRRSNGGAGIFSIAMFQKLWHRVMIPAAFRQGASPAVPTPPPSSFRFPPIRHSGSPNAGCTPA